MGNRKFFAIIFLLLTASCGREAFEPSTFKYPDSKFWAHGVNTVKLINEKAPLFKGLEVDLNYSEWQDKIFMGHELWDTIRGFTFDMWLDSMPHPIDKCLWLDFKNLSRDNAPRVAHLLLESCRRYGIEERVMVEHTDMYALRTVKDSGLHVILWVDNPYFSGASDKDWKKRLESQIDYLHPDALSSDYHNFPRLPDAFPKQNIHIWDTPREYNDTNAAHSRMIANHPAVKVVLIDYPEPIDN